MADIEIETSEVEGLLTNIEELYSGLSTKISNLNQQKDSISKYWSSREATLFMEQLDKVANMFESFDQEYSNFILSLKNFIKIYNGEEENIISSINSFSSEE